MCIYLIGHANGLLQLKYQHAADLYKSCVTDQGLDRTVASAQITMLSGLPSLSPSPLAF